MVQVRLHIYIDQDGKKFITPDRMALLQKVRSTGSMVAAAKECNISYQNAWTMIHEMNELSPEPIVEKHRGGKNGGGAILSAYGVRLLTEYDSINQMVNNFNQRLNVEINL